MLRLGLKVDPDTPPIEILGTLDRQSKNTVIECSDVIRHFVESCQISAKALSLTIPDLEVSKLDAPYQNITNMFTPHLDDVRKYTFEIHETFVKGTIERVMAKMDSYYEQFSKK